MSLDNGRIHKVVTNIYTKREEEGFLQGPLRLEESVELIIQLANREIAIVIDALDECDPTVRHRLLSGLTRVVKEAPGLVKVFISSRDDEDITLRLENLPNLYITTSHNPYDIEQFVRSEVDQAIKDKRLLNRCPSASLVEAIMERLTKQTQGM